MSKVDLTKVAGFKAVDAEGNDMGIVSLSEMTNMVKESIIQEAVAMQSVSTLAETSTQAATDTYEDRLPTSDTFSYVRTLDSSGNPKRTSQNALATVVGGLDIKNIGVKRHVFTINNDEETHTNLNRKGVYIISSNITSSIIVIVYSVAAGTPLSMINYIGNTIGITNDKTIYVSSGNDGIIIKNNHNSVINIVIREIFCE